VRNVIWIFLFLSAQFFSSEAAFREGDYVITGFRSTSRDFPQTGIGLIKGASADTLEEIDSVPSVQPGQIILRRKLDGEYRLYKGMLDTAAFNNRSNLYYAFQIPGWARISDLIHYRIYRAPTDKPGSDEDLVFFDSERIYLRQFSRIYYFRNGNWFSLEGSASLQQGTIKVTSTPEGAQVIINGVPSGKITPCEIEGLIPGTYVLELFLPDHHFYRKLVPLFPKGTVSVSFELFSDMDTVFITGKAPHGVLILPQPPVDKRYRIDSVMVDDYKVRLLPGEHRLYWDGGALYKSIDTVITIEEGRISFFDYLFRRQYGVLRVVPDPGDAEVCIQNYNCRIGEQIIEVPTGRYSVSAFRHGFRNLKKDIIVLPDSIVNCEMSLMQIPDRDADGYIDNVDRCPDVYGLHDGCPRQKMREAIEGKRQDLIDYIRNDHFGIGFTVMGMILKIPTRKHFSNFLSTFSSGKIGGVNNYRGLTFGNMIEVMYRGLFASVELGQWTAGLHYQRPDTMELKTRNTTYLVYYDSIMEVEPVLFLPSTAISLGVHYNWSWLNLVYSIGYQWEDIIIDQIYDVGKQEFSRITFDNDWWFHQLYTELDFQAGEFFEPSVYFKFKFPFGPFKWTRWHVLQAGLQIKLFPHLHKGKKK
jgi:hypothetical protein